jgi:hypothetical protein
MTNREAAEYMIRDFDDFRDLLTGIAKTHPKLTNRYHRPAASYVVAAIEDGKSKATIVMNHGTVTAFHAAEYDEKSHKWDKTTLNFGSRFNSGGIPAQVQYHESVHQTRIGIPLATIEEIPIELSERLYGAVALFGTVEN